MRLMARTGRIACPPPTLVHTVADAGSRDDPLEARAVASLLGGDRGAYDYLVTKYMRRVVSIAWGIVRNSSDAEELAQEAFVRGFETRNRFRAGQPFGPWIYRIVTNLSLDLLKHRGRVRLEELDGAEPAARLDGADQAAASNEIAARIDQAMQSLPDMQRVVARLYLVEQFDRTEIAAMTGLTEGTVRSHLSLARKKLREKLSDLYGGGDD